MAEEFITLTKGGIKKLLTEKEQIVTVQVLTVREGATSDQHKISIWDGSEIFYPCGLSTHLNHLLSNGTLDKFSVIRIDNYRNFEEDNKRNKILLLDVTVLAILDSKFEYPQQIDAGEEDEPPNEIVHKEEQIDEPFYAPLIDANPGLVSSVKLRGRCIKKSPIFRFAGGTKWLFTCHFIDKDGEMRMTFRENQADRFYSTIYVGNVYVLQYVNALTRDERYNQLGTTYELHATERTTVTENYERGSQNCPLIKYSFQEIEQIITGDNNVGSFVDTIGVCVSVNFQTTPKYVLLKDQSPRKICLTILDGHVEDLQDLINTHPVILIRNAVVQTLNNEKSLYYHASHSDLQINPQTGKAHQLSDWFHSVKVPRNPLFLTANTSNLKKISQIHKEAAGFCKPNDEHGYYYSTKGTITKIDGSKAMYRSCTIRQCLNEVQERENMKWWCSQCKVHVYNSIWRTKLEMVISDDTGNLMVTCLKELAEIILGKSEPEYCQLFTAANQDSFLTLVQSKMNQNIIVTGFRQADIVNGQLEMRNHARRISWNL